METGVTIGTVHTFLSTAQIETACTTLLAADADVSVRQVMRSLKQHHGASGRTDRVAQILKRMKAEVHAADTPALLDESSLAMKARRLQGELGKALQRAQRSEELEREHQDFWATRYAEKRDELEQAHAQQVAALTQLHSAQYLRLSQRAAELAVRLARYETVAAIEAEVSVGSRQTLMDSGMVGKETASLSTQKFSR